MKRWISAILALVLLCNAVPAMAAMNIQDRKDKLRERLGTTAGSGETEARKAAMDGIVEILLSGDREAIAALMHEDMRREKTVDVACEVVMICGNVQAWERIDYSYNAQSGRYAARYHVIGDEAERYLDIEVDADNWLVNVSTHSVLRQDEVTVYELDAELDYEALALEIMQALISGDYAAVLQKANPETFANVTQEQLAGIVKMYGEIAAYSLFQAQAQSGYVLMVYDVAQEYGPTFWELTLSGNGTLAGFYVENKFNQREKMTEEEMREASDKAKEYIDLIDARDAEALYNALNPYVKSNTNPAAFEELFELCGAVKPNELYDMWRLDTYTGLDILIGEDRDTMLRLILAEDGSIFAINSTEVFRVNGEN